MGDPPASEASEARAPPGRGGSEDRRRPRRSSLVAERSDAGAWLIHNLESRRVPDRTRHPATYGRWIGLGLATVPGHRAHPELRRERQSGESTYRPIHASPSPPIWFPSRRGPSGARAPVRGIVSSAVAGQLGSIAAGSMLRSVCSRARSFPWEHAPEHPWSLRTDVPLTGHERCPIVRTPPTRWRFGPAIRSGTGVRDHVCRPERRPARDDARRV